MDTKNFKRLRNIGLYTYT